MGSQTIEQTIERDELYELAQLETALQGRLRGYVRDFRMTVREGGLVLYGRARTYYGKQLAQHGVMERSRLSIRANNIDVL